MADKKIEVPKEVDALALHSEKSERNGSGWQNVLEVFKYLTQGRLEIREAQGLSLSRFDKSISKLNDLGKNPKTDASRKRFDTNLKFRELSSTATSEDGFGDWQPLTIGVLAAWWDNPSFALKSRWTSPASFLTVMRDAYGAYGKTMSDNRAKIAKISTDATRLVYEPSVSYATTWVYLGRQGGRRTLREIDKSFLYARLCKSRDGEIYWRSKNGEIALIPFDTRGVIMENPSEPACKKFWELFDEDCEDDLTEKFPKLVVQKADALRLERKTDDETGMPIQPVDDELAEDIPRCVLRELSLGLEVRIETTPEGKKTSFNRYRSAISDTQTKAASTAIEEWHDAFAAHIRKYIYDKELDTLANFSNIPGCGLCTISLDGIDVTGSAGISRAAQKVLPQPPKAWSSFLFGRDGKRPIFAADVEMSILRLCWFVVQCVHDNGNNVRQALILSGVGNSGKSVLAAMVAELMGDAAVDIAVKRMNHDGETYGMLNKALIVFSEAEDAAKVIRDPLVKSITGGDTISLRAMCQNSVRYTPDHTRVIITTNYLSRVSGEHEISRILPLSLIVNYTFAEQLSKEEIKANCGAERIEFLQWCFDMTAYYMNVRNAKGETLPVFKRNGLQLLTDEDYHRWLESGFDESTSWSLLTKQAIEHCSGDSPFFSVTLTEDATAEQEEMIELLIDTLFEVTGNENDTLSRRDLVLAISTAATSKKSGVSNLVGLCGLREAAFTNSKAYKAFTKALRSRDGVSEYAASGYFRFRGVKLKALRDISLIDTAENTVTDITSDEF